MNDMNHVYFIILAGGGGTRLWPKSRKKTPKQFLNLSADNSLMQIATQRAKGVVPWERIIVVTNKDYADEVAKQLPQIPPRNIIAEPEKKDTALAMLTGALFAKSLDPEAAVANLASDHIISDDQEFVRVISAALTAASEKKHLVAIGITPTFPSSGFGYIKIGEDVKRISGQTVFRVENFTEKPNVATARAFISTGKYFWNANMYVWSVAALLSAFEQHMPSLYEKTKPLHSGSPDNFADKLTEVYQDAESISIDYAISEKADNLLLIPGDFGWNDVGDWKVVYDLGKKDIAGNVIISDDEKAEVMTVESKNNLIHADGRMIATLGVDDMVIIDTPEILLIIPKSRSQDVKKIADRLKDEELEKYL